MRIEDVDKNFKVQEINKTDLKLYNPEEKPFKIYGIKRYNGEFLRMPDEVAKNTSEDVRFLNKNTAGGRIRFKTNSSYVALFIKYNTATKMDFFPMTGSMGVDLYATYNGKQMYVNTFRFPLDTEEGFEYAIDTEFDGKMMEYTINLPLYSGIADVFIGLQEGATIEEPSPYRNELPVVFYGSSITQGAGASRPGLCYEAILSRRFNFDYVNLGFSGSAKAEEAVVDYIANMSMSIFVMDYDHNAPDAEHLRATHEPFFKKVRQHHPDMPIIILAAPVFDKQTFPNKHFAEREEIVKKTYLNAIANGDKNVYFLDGKTLVGMCGYDWTTDNCHPNDFGFHSMATAVAKIMEKLYN